jgi:hypothetical protein
LRQKVLEISLIKVVSRKIDLDPLTGSNTTLLSYNASALKTHNTPNSLVRLQSTNVVLLEKNSSLPQLRRFLFKVENTAVVGLAP